MGDSNKRKLCFCSWSGGKDSCFALYKAIQNGFECKTLLTMVEENEINSRSHGLSVEVLKMQSSALGIPVKTVPAAWGNYEAVYKEQISLLKKEQIFDGVFGDIDLEAHREWIQRVCADVGVNYHLPLWKQNRRMLVEEFVILGFKALIVAINIEKMSESYLGRELDHALIEELESQGIDACGENGEFHTFVYAGPIFIKPVSFTKGEICKKGNHSFLSITIKNCDC